MISEYQVKAAAARYTLEELTAKRDEAMDEMDRGSMIASASSSGGGSYSRIEQMTPRDRVELYQRAIDYKESGVLDEGVCEVVKVFVDYGINV